MQNNVSSAERGCLIDGGKSMSLGAVPFASIGRSALETIR
jgi:hypothetical protein